MEIWIAGFVGFLIGIVAMFGLVRDALTDRDFWYRLYRRRNDAINRMAEAESARYREYFKDLLDENSPKWKR